MVDCVDSSSNKRYATVVQLLIYPILFCETVRAHVATSHFLLPDLQISLNTVDYQMFAHVDQLDKWHGNIIDGLVIGFMLFDAILHVSNLNVMLIDIQCICKRTS